MIKNKFKCLLIILFLFIANNPLKVLAYTTNRNTQPNGNTLLEGEIGEWAPSTSGIPGSGMEVEGNIPNKDEYFTISVTVPVSMEFMVLPSSTLAFGSFYSPNYTIKNSGFKTIVAKVRSFSIDNTVTLESDETTLYIENVLPGDGKTQMELKLCTLDDTIFNNIDKKIDLKDVSALNEDEKTLCKLIANEEKKIKFYSDRWELPQYESQKDKAKSNYIVSLEFSIANP